MNTTPPIGPGTPVTILKGTFLGRRGDVVDTGVLTDEYGRLAVRIKGVLGERWFYPSDLKPLVQAASDHA